MVPGRGFRGVVPTGNLDLYFYLDNARYDLELPVIRNSFEIVMDNVSRARRRAGQAGAA